MTGARAGRGGRRPSEPVVSSGANIRLLRGALVGAGVALQHFLSRLFFFLWARVRTLELRCRGMLFAGTYKIVTYPTTHDY